MRKIIFLSTMLTSLATQAAQCNDYQHDKAAHFAEIQGQEIVRKYNGGNNIRTSITKCEFNNYSNHFKVDIDVYWNGILTGDGYYSSGTMTMDSAGKNRSYNETYRNQNLKDYAMFINIVAGAMILSAAAAEEEGASSNQPHGYDIRVTNRCNKDANLILKYKNPNNHWETRNWSIQSNDSVYLANEGRRRIKTNNASIYYATHPNIEPWKTTNHSITYNGVTYPAVELVDKDGETELYLCR